MHGCPFVSGNTGCAATDQEHTLLCMVYVCVVQVPEELTM
jgi:hypothetical protein